MTRTKLSPFYLIYDKEADEILTNMTELFWDSSCFLDNCGGDLSEVADNAVFWNLEEAKRARDLVNERILEWAAIPEQKIELQVIEVQRIKVSDIINEWRICEGE